MELEGFELHDLNCIFLLILTYLYSLAWTTYLKLAILKQGLKIKLSKLKHQKMLSERAKKLINFLPTTLKHATKLTILINIWQNHKNVNKNSESLSNLKILYWINVTLTDYLIPQSTLDNAINTLKISKATGQAI